MNNKRNKKNINVPTFPKDILWVVSIIIIASLNLGKLYGPAVLPDETGYWAAGYFFTGKSWNDVMGVSSSYYGWGYGVLLSAICLLPISQALKYRVAVIVNSIMLALVFCVIKRLLNKFNFINDENDNSFVAFLLTFGSSSIFYSQTTYCETLLYLLWWLILGYVYNVLTESCIKDVFLLSIAVSFSYAVHNRMIVIIISTVILFAFCFVIKKINAINVLIYCISIVVGFIAVHYVKNHVTEHVYKNNSVAQVVSGGGLVQNIIDQLVNGGLIKKLMTNALGEIYYCSTSTWLLFLIGIIVIIQYLKRSGITSSISVWLIFSLVSFIGLLGISVLSLYQPGRFDHIFYGRYIEFAIGPIILMAIVFFKDLKPNMIALCCLVYFVVSKMVSVLIMSYELGRASGFAIPGVFGFSFFEATNMNSLLLCSLVSVIVFGICFFARTRLGIKQMVCVLSIVTLFVGFRSVDKSLYTEQQFVKQVNSFADESREFINDNVVYYLIDDTEYVSWKRFLLKYFWPDTELIVKELYEYDDIPEEALLVITESHHYSYGSNVIYSIEPIYSSDFFGLYKKFR